MNDEYGEVNFVRYENGAFAVNSDSRRFPYENMGSIYLDEEEVIFRDHGLFGYREHTINELTGIIDVFPLILNKMKEIDQQIQHNTQGTKFLYLLQRKDHVSYDECHDVVIRAKSEEEARQIASNNAGSEGSDSWLNEFTSSCSILTPDGKTGIVIENSLNG